MHGTLLSIFSASINETKWTRVLLICIWHYKIITCRDPGLYCNKWVAWYYVFGICFHKCQPVFFSFRLFLCFILFSFLFLFLFCFALLCFALLCFVLSFLVLSCFVSFCFVLSCLGLSCFVFCLFVCLLFVFICCLFLFNPMIFS